MEKAVMEYFDVWRIGGGGIAEVRVKEMIASAVIATATTQNMEDLM
jgi:hypothetical protein